MTEPTYKEALDERLKKALEQSQYRTTFLKQHEQLKLKKRQDLTLAKNGGSFQATRELLNFVYMLVDAGETSAIIEDEHENPISIDDLPDFRNELIRRYLTAMNTFYVDLAKLRKARTVEALLK